MSDPVIVAFIAGAVAFGVAYINSVLSESYRRFRDRTTLAASLAGELGAYENAWPILTEMLDQLIEGAEADSPALGFLRPMERPKDFIYEKSVERLGLLGASACESVVYVYSNINAFRQAFEIIAREHKEMSPLEIQSRAKGCQAALQRAATRGEVLLNSLRRISNAKFVPDWPWSPWLALLPW